MKEIYKDSFDVSLITIILFISSFIFGWLSTFDLPFESLDIVFSMGSVIAFVFGVFSIAVLVFVFPTKEERDLCNHR